MTELLETFLPRPTSGERRAPDGEELLGPAR
jgi:hypothetical protein